MQTPSHILEVTAGSPIPTVQPSDVLLVTGDANIAETCRVLQENTVAPRRIAFVTPTAKHLRRRVTASLGLSACFECPCRVFTDEATARRWLTETA